MDRDAGVEAKGALIDRAISHVVAPLMQVAKRRGQERAKVALARRLGVIMHRMWMGGSEFRWSRDAADAVAVASTETKQEEKSRELPPWRRMSPWGRRTR